MSTYHVETEGGHVYQVETDDAPQVGALESAARGAGNNFPLLPQAIAGGESVMGKGDYSSNLADWKQKAADAKAAHPVAYGAGAVAGATAPLLIPGVGEALEAAPVAGNALYGAASAIGDTDLSKDPGQGLKDAAIGAVVGGGAGTISKGLSSAADATAPYVKEFGQSQALKSQGITRGLVGKLGPEDSLQVGQDLINRGIVNPAIGQRGARQMVDDLTDQAGTTIGNIRAAGGQAPSRDQVIQMLKDQFEKKYSGGLYSGEASTFKNVMDELAGMPEQPTFQQWADKSTMLNKFASDQSGLMRASNAESDVADTISNLNDSALQKAVPADQFSGYEKAKQTFGAMQPIQQIQAKGQAREIASRGGATLGSRAFEKTYEGPLQKAVAVGASKVGDVLGGQGVQKGISGASMNTTAGVTSTILQALHTNPQSLGQFAKPLAQAAQGGPQGIAATHYVLSQQYPAYNEMWQKHQKEGE